MHLDVEVCHGMNVLNKPNTITQDNKPEVWIVIVTYNGQDWIGTALESLKRQTYSCLTVHVVDNASIDKTAKVVENFSVKFHRMETNMGYGRAANFIIRRALKAGVPWVFVLNQDIILEPDCIERLVGAGLVASDYGMLTPLQIRYDENVVDSGMLWILQKQADLFSDALLGRVSLVYPVCFILGAAMFLRLKAIQQVGCFDETFHLYGEDNDLCRRFHLHGWKLGIVPAARVRHWHSAIRQRDGYDPIFPKRRAAEYSLILKKPTRNLFANLLIFVAAFFIFPVKHCSRSKSHRLRRLLGCWKGARVAIRRLPALLQGRAEDIRRAQSGSAKKE